MKTTGVHKATKSYEAWLAGHTALVPEDVELKHREMASAPFPFFRATFYRWAQIWPNTCARLVDAPTVLAVGDLHIENFGTWRDAEGRLIWGINDFDEAVNLPYTVDLVRLATSALLAINASHLDITASASAEAILAGYTNAMESGGTPFVLAERDPWLRDLATSKLRDPVAYWAKLDKLPVVQQGIPESAAVAIERLLPAQDLPYRIKHRIAGLGSLGRQRYCAVADWRGGKLAREAKPLVPSAAVWAGEVQGVSDILYQAIMDRSVRCADPFVHLEGLWIVRRLAPDCSRIELADLPKQKPETKLLNAMGAETANVHLGSPQAAKAICQDLKKRPKGWLAEAAKAMEQATLADHEDWKRG
jgi:hypothetical protein